MDVALIFGDLPPTPKGKDMKDKPITKKELIRRGLTDKAYQEVKKIVEDLSGVSEVVSLTSPMGNPVQDTSEPLKELL